MTRVLPVAWDGVPVTWTDWAPEPVVFTCPPQRPSPCPGCRQIIVINRRQHARGTVHLGPEGRSPGILYAYRCACGHDTVVDLHTGEVWELDPSDYGPTGSWPGDPALF